MERLAHDLGHTQKRGVPYITVNPHSSAPRRRLARKRALPPSCLPVVNPFRLYKGQPDQIEQFGASSWFQPPSQQRACLLPRPSLRLACHLHLALEEKNIGK